MKKLPTLLLWLTSALAAHVAAQRAAVTVDPTNKQITTDVDLSSTHFVGTLSPKRLPGGVQSVGNFGYRDNAADAAFGVDSRVAGKVRSFTNLLGPGTANRFSTWINTAGSHTFVRNPACWAADIDLTCVSVANSADADGTGGNRGCVTLITPLEGVTNHHFSQIYQPGVVHYFVGLDGVTYPATVAGSAQQGASDMQVVTFTAALPAAVRPAKVLPANAAAQVLAVGTPLLSLNQQQQAIVTELSALGVAGGELSIRSALAANRVPWTVGTGVPIVTGDSDQPTFVLLGGEAVLVTTFHGITTMAPLVAIGPDYSAHVDAITALLGGGRTLGVAALNLLPPVGNAALLAASNTWTGGNVFSGGIISNASVEIRDFLSDGNGGDNWHIAQDGSALFGGGLLDISPSGDLSTAGTVGAPVFQVIASTLPAATLALAGHVRYSGGHFYGCDGTTWKPLDN